MLQVSVIRDPGEFDTLEGEWTGLLSRSRSNSVTLTWPWLSAWWRVYHEMRSMRVIAVRENGRLIGAAPMLVRETSCLHYRVLPFRRIELMASGESAGHEVCSDYIDWIAETGRETAVISALLDCLCGALEAEWEELFLPDLSEDSPNLDPLRQEALRRDLIFEILRREPCAVIRLPQTWEDFLHAVTSGLRYQIRRGRRELEQLGGTYRVVSDPGELPEAVDILIRLHQQRWTAKGKRGAFGSPLRNAFHQRFMPLALRAGWLRLGILRVGDEPVGAIYNLSYAGKVYFYQSGITLPANKHLRPGLLMHGFEVEAAIRSACTEYDFLKRGHSEYKDAWANARRNLLCVRIARRTAKEKAYEWTRFMYETLREVKHRFSYGERAAQ